MIRHIGALAHGKLLGGLKKQDKIGTLGSGPHQDPDEPGSQ